MKHSSDLNELWEIGFQYIIAKSIAIAVEQDLHHHLMGKSLSISELSEKLGFNEIACKRFLRVLDAYGIVSLINDIVTPTEKTAFLEKLKSPHLFDAYLAVNELEYSLQKNEACWERAYGKAFYPYLQDHPEKLEQFSEWCSQSGTDWLPCVFNMYDFSIFQKLADVGGGLGLFLSAILSKHVQMEGILFDQPQVIAQAANTPHIKKCIPRMKLIPGDFLKSVPPGADGYLLCRVLLNWNDEQAVQIMNRCYDAMPLKSKLLVIDFCIPDKASKDYKRAVICDLNLLAMVNSSIRTKEEWQELAGRSKLKLKNVLVSDERVSPEPFSPIVILECVKEN